ncbi:MAG: sensor histidine kinase [Thaumarchaeota archaeon]|nr:sensor histidine kinase [Nitrososphaerota archaeon]
MNRPSIIPIIIISSTILITLALLLIIQQYMSHSMSDLNNDKQNKIKILADRLELRLSNAINVIKLSSKNEVMQSTPYSSFISYDLKGIPADMDMPKREIARNLIQVFQDFKYVFYAMPNGDLYITEPFAIQVNNSALNFAFRDWYKGAIQNHDTYVSEVYVSATTKHNVVAISSPVYHDTNSSLAGIWVGVLDINSVKQKLAEENFGKNEHIVIIDHHENLVASNNYDDDFKKIESTSRLKAVDQALTGNSGLEVESISGVHYVIAYDSIPVQNHNWAILSIQPSDDAYHTINEILYPSAIILAVIVAISSISGFIIYKSFRKGKLSSQKLEKLNEELKDKSTKLQEMDRSKEEFSAMISHELKTPLVTISGYAEMLREENGILGSLNNEQVKAVEKISSETAKLERLIGDILDAQKLDLERMKFSKKEFEVDKFLDEQIQIHSNLMNEKKIHFANTTKEKMSLVSDEHRLSQVFANLIKNAVDFVPPHFGSIEINAQRKNGQIAFYVKDNGSGIPEQKQKHLFQRFYQIDTSLKRSHGGTGLGLVICKGIVEALGGKIWIESQPGKGTTVFFTIPENSSSKS